MSSRVVAQKPGTSLFGAIFLFVFATSMVMLFDRFHFYVFSCLVAKNSNYDDLNDLNSTEQIYRYNLKRSK